MENTSCAYQLFNLFRPNIHHVNSHLLILTKAKSFMIILKRYWHPIHLYSTCPHYFQRGRIDEVLAVAITVSLFHVSLVPLLSVSSTCRRRTLCTAGWKRTLCGPWRASTHTSTTGFGLPRVCPGTGCWAPLQWVLLCVLTGTNYHYNDGCWSLQLIEIVVRLRWSHPCLRMHHIITETEYHMCCLVAVSIHSPSQCRNKHILIIYVIGYTCDSETSNPDLATHWSIYS